MKKVLCLLFALFLMAVGFPVTASAAETGSCGENVTWTLEGDTLTISGTGSTADYTTLDSAPWYSLRTQIRTIVVEEGVTRLGEHLFAYHLNATEAKLPTTLKEIGKEAFLACYELKRADLPEGLEIIGEGAFSSCLPLDGIVLPESLERIESYAFHFTGLTSITIPKSITTLEEHTFGSCKKLKTVNFHEDVDTIHDFCFSGCESLRTIELPEKLKEISWGCFSISGLESITIPEGVEIIDSYAFSQCKALEEIIIPNTVTVMEQYCLRQTESLKTVDLPDGLKETGWGMFQQGGLETIELPEGLTRVAEYTFCDCDSLTEVIIPDTVCYMLDYCFRDCDSLKTVELPERMQYLGYGMFMDSGLETLVIPDSVSRTEDYVFSGCDNLISITYPDRPFTFGDYAFAYCDGPVTFDLPQRLTQLSWGMFTRSTIEYIDIPDTVKQVEDYAFCDCDYLEEVVFPDGITVMGDYVFRNCDSIRSVHMPASLKHIPWGCFWNSSIPELTIHDGVTEIGNQAFWDAYNLEKLVVPASVTKVGTTKVFDGADRLVIYCWPDSFIHRYAEENGIPYVLMEEPEEPATVASGWSGYTLWELTDDGTLTVRPSGNSLNGKVNMKHYWKVNGVLNLPWSAYAQQITRIVVEEGVNGIGQMAFYELPNLQEVVLADSVDEIYGYNFKNCTNLTSINLENVRFIRQGAFYGCTGLTEVTFNENVYIEQWAFAHSGVAHP